MSSNAPNPMLFDAVKSKKVEQVEIALTALNTIYKSTFINQCDGSDRTPLSYALEDIPNSEAVALVLLQNGADGTLGIALDNETTALHLAVNRSFLTVCKMLLDKDPEAVTKKNKQGVTPMSLALTAEKMEVAQCLWERGEKYPDRYGSYGVRDKCCYRVIVK
jgi:ankyrin repeat protein